MKNYNINKVFYSSIDNSLFRGLFKFIYKLTYPKSYKHNRYYWPYYNVERNYFNGINKIFFKKKLIVDNSKPIFTQKKCILVATGPSIKKISIKTLFPENIDYWGVNGAIALEEICFNYYVIIDHNFIDERFDLVIKVLQSDCIFFTTPRCLDIILRKFSPNDIICTIKVIELITRGKIDAFLGSNIEADINSKYYFIENGKGFSKNIHNALFDYFTVAYVALQIIYSLGAKEIYLAGLDMNNFNKPRFYEKNDNKQPTMLDYHSEEVLQAFQVAAKFLKKEDIQVYNLSVNSAVTSFQKLDPTVLESS